MFLQTAGVVNSGQPSDEEVGMKRIALVAVSLAVGALLLTPAGAHVTDSFRHLWRTHIKPRVDREMVTDRGDLKSIRYQVESVTCPDEKKVVGGGGRIQGAFRGRENAPRQVAIVRSSPHESDPRKWVVAARETSPTDAAWRITASAICTHL